MASSDEKKLEILVLSVDAPYPPYHGGTMRTIQSLEALAACHSITFFGTFNKQQLDRLPEVRRHLTRLCSSVFLFPQNSNHSNVNGYQRILKQLLSYPPKHVTRFTSTDYSSTVANLVTRQPFDIIICNSILTGHLIPHLHTNAQTVLDTIDLFSSARQRIYATATARGLTKFAKYVDWRKTLHYERRLWKYFDGMIAISSSDAAFIKRFVRDKPIAEIPVGISIPDVNSLENTNRDFDLLFVGKLDYHPNIDALQYFDHAIFPLVAETKPDIQIAIVGKNPAPQIEVLVQKKRANYHLYANVPDVAPYYNRTKIVVIPIRLGSGIKVKAIEALSYALPVVSTSFGTFGIPVRNNEHMLIGDPPIEFAAHILRLLKSEKLREQLGASGRKFVEERYAVEAVMKNYQGFVRSVSA